MIPFLVAFFGKFHEWNFVLGQISQSKTSAGAKENGKHIPFLMFLYNLCFVRDMNVRSSPAILSRKLILSFQICLNAIDILQIRMNHP
jgi:hypothetical protein